jgi:hypothetical protein
MKFEITYQLRAFPVEITDTRTGARTLDAIILDKRTLENARAVGLDHEALICRLYNRQGYHVHRIGPQTKQTATVDLSTLYHPAGAVEREGLDA